MEGVSLKKSKGIIMDKKDNITEIIFDDELINNCKFGLRICLTGRRGDVQDYSEKNILSFQEYSDLFMYRN